MHRMSFGTPHADPLAVMGKEREWKAKRKKERKKGKGRKRGGRGGTCLENFFLRIGAALLVIKGPVYNYDT